MAEDPTTGPDPEPEDADPGPGERESVPDSEPEPDQGAGAATEPGTESKPETESNDVVETRAEEVVDEEGIDEEEIEREGDGGDAAIPADVRRYERFKKMDGAQYERVNEFLRDRTYVTAREWAIARLCADFRTETGVEMTKIGENLPELVPFMTDTYSPQAVNQARSSFEDKVTKAGATFLYGAMSGFFTAEKLDDLMYEVTEVAKFLLEVEGVDLAVEDELDTEERISEVMREVRQSSAELRASEVECPNCGHVHEPRE